MKIIETVKVIKTVHPNSIVFVRIGKFYHVYGKDAYIIAHMFNYRLNKLEENYTCGFPISAINKVQKDIENKKISYIMVNRSCNYEVEEKEDYKSQNKYTEYYEKASKVIKLKNRINNIKVYLNKTLENEKMLYKLKQIEDIINEK